jgi:hypothetical protein
MFSGETLDDLVDQVDAFHGVFAQTRVHTRRTPQEIALMIARANAIGLRRAAAEAHVSASWLSRVRSGKLKPISDAPSISSN